MSSQLEVVVANLCSITERKTLPTFTDTEHFGDYDFNETQLVLNKIDHVGDLV